MSELVDEFINLTNPFSCSKINNLAAASASDSFSSCSVAGQKSCHNNL